MFKCPNLVPFLASGIAFSKSNVPMKRFPAAIGIPNPLPKLPSKAVGESVEKPLLYYRNNLVSLINLLELLPKHGIEGIVFSSS